MNINKENLKWFWFQDSEGNRYYNSDDTVVYEPPVGVITYHSACPFSLSEEICEYKANPLEGEVRFKHICTGHTTWDERVVLAMANSGDYSLSEAIFIYARACERCINVLWDKYVPEAKEGYAEYSEEWYKSRTRCDWCRDEK